ncbi:hypothetical protein HYDPIDRAFT_30991 [Hydnomerulius pinastri MD-312]|uniref:CCHC-type domain-containing protein n=1 Tax=Hydnomerulius pinastri MD-312 TaxID=994086 RepID=A0A0C9V8B2_9AGAM|nr:hypothetical protein HYDPIDRAFT_30991 [Hydnomerulius pinastri MD-312]
MTCYHCKQVGHIASERQKCPDGNNPRVFAAHVIDESQEDDSYDRSSGHDESQVNPGPQDESVEGAVDDEGVTKSSHVEVELYLAEYEEDNSSEADSEVVYLCAMSSGTPSTQPGTNPMTSDLGATRESDKSSRPPWWTHDSDMGVTHFQGDCDICDQYREHRQGVRDEDELLLVFTELAPKHLLNEAYERRWSDAQMDIMTLCSPVNTLTVNRTAESVHRGLRDAALSLAVSATGMESTVRFLRELGDHIQSLQEHTQDEAANLQRNGEDLQVQRMTALLEGADTAQTLESPTVTRDEGVQTTAETSLESAPNRRWELCQMSPDGELPVSFEVRHLRAMHEEQPQ